MNHLNIISFICLILWILYIKFMINKPERTRNIFLNIQLSIVLIYNVFIIIIFPYKVPAEFSTLSYFVVPFIALLNIKQLRLWAAYSALLAGLGYYFSMILAGNAMYSHFPVYSVLTSIFNHGSLLAYAVIVIAHHNITKYDKYILTGGLLFNMIWAILVRPFVLHPGVVFIFYIIDGYLVTRFFPGSGLFGQILYWIWLWLTLFGTIKIIYVINSLFKRTKKSETKVAKNFEKVQL